MTKSEFRAARLAEGYKEVGGPHADPFTEYSLNQQAAKIAALLPFRGGDYILERAAALYAVMHERVAQDDAKSD